MSGAKKRQKASTSAALAEPERAKSLSTLLSKNEHAKDLLQDAVGELSSVNTVLKEQLAEKNPPPQVESALEKSAVVEGKVHVVTETLGDVNRALKGEVRDRVLLEHQLAAISEQEEAARHAAFHDPLTGLPNRMLFHDRLERGLAHAQRHGWSLAVMFIDLDSFKAINDTHGHDAGDRVLMAIAKRLTASTRIDDTISRYGGDEFLYLLMEAGDPDEVRLIAEKIIATVVQPCDIDVGDVPVRLCVRASIGIALYPRNGKTAEALIKSADAAMYRAKKEKSGCAFAA